MLITVRGKKKSFNLVGIMPGRVRSFDILDPCPSHNLRLYPSMSIVSDGLSTGDK